MKTFHRLKTFNPQNSSPFVKFINFLLTSELIMDIIAQPHLGTFTSACSGPLVNSFCKKTNGNITPIQACVYYNQTVRSIGFLK